MCLAVPGKVLEIVGDDPLLRSAKVSFAGVIKLVSLTCAPEARVGDFVLVHVGVAISVIDAAEAASTYAYLKAMGDLDGLEVPTSPAAVPPDKSRAGAPREDEAIPRHPAP